MNVATKKCLACNKPLQGRLDKKFCNDYCRNLYNNQKISSTNSNLIRNINNALKRNRKILGDYLGEKEMVKIPKQKLIDQGFNFNFITNILPTKKGHQYLFCYEYGYLILENPDWVLIVKKKVED